MQDNGIEKHLLSDYLICISKDNLILPVKFFEYLKQTQDTEIIEMIDDVTTLALDCIYSCDDLDMYEKAKIIFDSVSRDHYGNMTNATCNLLEECEEELDCIKCLNKYGVKTTLKFIKKNKNDPDIARSLLNQMARSFSKRYVRDIKMVKYRLICF